ncbi:hypothetical protein QN362_06030 [Actimicrobium sp. CCC2.4]|jgi:hypothetical protein|uniref:hypothetical protein n=1 Tax=Actimicrobium sp. CCC2.4 TaxID=3048606 RepID=UPI002AC9B5FE|nr:hypothetical protein [Actimicrobium sp. CCC2.4]MEB0134884.1 hypothetical protein [Actimicrobium sp. CCC2.4]WPX32063.1 hypothetical protein RHM62_17805 [Actimicrobium sp. CCC2.4]
MRLSRPLILLALTLTTLSALAFDRPFPAGANRASLVITDYPQVQVDGKAARLSQGARIWSTDNLTVIPNTLGHSAHIVNYTTDLDGAINRVWLLSAAEAAVRLPAKPTTSSQNQ